MELDTNNKRNIMTKSMKANVSRLSILGCLSFSVFFGPAVSADGRSAALVPIKVTVTRPEIKQYFYPTATAGTYNLKEQETDKINVHFESIEEFPSTEGPKKWSKKFVLKEATAFPTQLKFGRHGDQVHVDTLINEMISRKMFRASPDECGYECPERTILTAENEHARTGDTLDLFIRGFLAYRGKGKVLVTEPRTQVRPVNPAENNVILAFQAEGVIEVKYPAVKVEFHAFHDTHHNEDFYLGQIDTGQPDTVADPAI